MNDNCVELTLSLSLGAEVFIFRGQKWLQGHGPGSTLAFVGPEQRWLPTALSTLAAGASSLGLFSSVVLILQSS